MKRTSTIAAVLLALTLAPAALADHHTGDSEAHADSDAQAQAEARAEARAERQRMQIEERRMQAEERRMEIEQRRMEAEARREELRANRREMEVLAEELARNSLELLEQSEQLDALGPEISERIRRSLVVVDRPLLGINVASPKATDDGVTGVAVVGVTPGGAADVAGVRSGDVIVAFDDLPLAAPTYREAERRLLDALSATESGEEVNLTLLRDGESVSVAATPTAGFRYNVHAGDTPAVWTGDGSSFAFAIDPALSGAQRAFDGLELVELTERLGRYFGTDSGLLAVRVPEDADLELEDGDVILAIGNRQPTSVGHAMRILRSYESGEALTLTIMRDQRRRELEMTIP